MWPHNRERLPNMLWGLAAPVAGQQARHCLGVVALPEVPLELQPSFWIQRSSDGWIQTAGSWQYCQGILGVRLGWGRRFGNLAGGLLPLMLMPLGCGHGAWHLGIVPGYSCILYNMYVLQLAYRAALQLAYPPAVGASLAHSTQALVSMQYCQSTGLVANAMAHVVMRYVVFYPIWGLL